MKTLSFSCSEDKVSFKSGKICLLFQMMMITQLSICDRHFNPFEPLIVPGWVLQQESNLCFMLKIFMGPRQCFILSAKLRHMNYEGFGGWQN